MEALRSSLLPGGDGGREEDGAEFAGGESVQGAQLAFEFDGGNAALAKEAAQKVFGGHFSLLRVAFNTAGNEIAAGVGPSACPRNDVVEDSPANDEPPQTIEAAAKFAHVNGLAAAAAL